MSFNQQGRIIQIRRYPFDQSDGDPQALKEKKIEAVLICSEVETVDVEPTRGDEMKLTQSRGKSWRRFWRRTPMFFRSHGNSLLVKRWTTKSR